MERNENKKITPKIILLVFLFGYFAFTQVSFAATMTISTTKNSYEVGEKVSIKILVSSQAPINAVSGNLNFNSSLLTVESVSKQNSILNFWVTEPSFSQSNGSASFEGVTLGGYQGGSGTVITINAKVTGVGTGILSVSSPKILANDGEGTDVTSGTSGKTLTFVPKTNIEEPVKQEPKEVLEEPVKQTSTLKSPEISSVRKFGEKAIYGTSSYPDQEVLLAFISGDGGKIFITGRTNNIGEFSMLVPSALKKGVYKVYAVIIERNKAYSVASNEIYVAVGTILSDVGKEVIWSLGFLIATLIYSIVRTYFYFKKNKKLRQVIQREAREAEKVLHSTFSELRKEINQTAEKKNPEKDLKSIKIDLNEVEERIEREIKDIENL
jgi:hypothetical protein